MARWYEQHVACGTVECAKCANVYVTAAIECDACPGCGYEGDRTAEILERLDRLEREVGEIRSGISEQARVTGRFVLYG